MPPVFSNNAVGLLAVAVTPVDTTLQLQPGQGAAFPVPASGQFVPLVVQSGATYEVVHCVARADDALVVERAKEGTAAAVWAVGSTVELRVTAGSLNGIVTASAAAEAAAQSAVTTANAASATAAAAQAAAGTAQTAAAAAQATADTAQTTAGTALTIAQAALPRNGSQSMTGAIQVAHGTAGGLRRQDEANTRIVTPGGGQWRVDCNGVSVLTADSTGVAIGPALSLTNPAMLGHQAARLDQIPAPYVRQFLWSTHNTVASTTSTAFVSTGAAITVTVSTVPSRVLVRALVTAPLWLETLDTASGGGGGGGGGGGEGNGESAEFRFSSSLGVGASSRISGTFRVPANIGTVYVGNYQALAVQEFRSITTAGTYVFTLMMRVTNPNEQVSTRANESPILLEAWEFAP